MKKLVALLLTFLLVLTGCNMVEVTKVDDDIETDSIRFSKEYELNNDENIYKYETYDNVMDVLKEETGIIYLGCPGCSLCKDVISILNDVAKGKNVKQISYYNFKEIRDNNTQEYIELSNVLSSYINEDDEGNKRIEAPTVIFVNKGNIVGVYIGTISNSEELSSLEAKENLKLNFSSLIDKMFVGIDE